MSVQIFTDIYKRPAARILPPWTVNLVYNGVANDLDTYIENLPETVNELHNGVKNPHTRNSRSYEAIPSFGCWLRAFFRRDP